jgi:hypothetical protein
MKKSHAAVVAADVRHLREHDLEFVHDLLLDRVGVRELRAFAQHHRSKIETLAHGSFHCATMHFVEGMNFGHEMLLRQELIVDWCGDLPPRRRCKR